MKYCSQCGQQLPDEAKFCNKCGAAMSEQEAAAASTEKEILPAAPAAIQPEEEGPNAGPGQPLQSNIPPIHAKPQGRGLPVKTRTIITGIVIALLLAAGGFWGWRGLGSEARVQQKLDLAVKYLSENKFEEAILAYNEAIKIEPKEVKAYQGLAKTYTIQGKYDDAKATYERGTAAVSSENKFQLRLGLAGMYIDKSDLKEAERYFQELINESKTCIDAYRGLALVYQQQGNKDRARAILEQGVKNNLSDYNAYVALARFYADSGDKEKALANIVKSLDLEVNQQEAYTILADLYKGKWNELINKADSAASPKTAVMLKLFAYYSDEKYSHALSQYKSGLEQDQNNLKARVLAAVCMLKNGEKDAASQLINKLVKIKTNTWIMADIAQYYHLAGDINLAIEWANKSLVINEQNIDVVKLLVEIYNKDNPELAKIAETRLIVYTWQPAKVIMKSVNPKTNVSTSAKDSEDGTNTTNKLPNTINTEKPASPQNGNRPIVYNNELSERMLIAINNNESNLVARVKSFLAAGADPNAKTFDVTALMFAVDNGNVEVVKTLLAAGAKVNTATTAGTALGRALDKPEIVKTLIAYGADVNLNANYFKTTALMSASSSGYLEVVKILLEAGAEVNIKDINGQTALYYAEDRKHFDIAELLRQYGAAK